MKTKEKLNPKTPVRFSNGGDVADKNNLRQLQIFRFNLLSRGIKEGSPQYEEQMREFVKNNPSQAANVAKSTEVFNQTQKEVAADVKRADELAAAEQAFLKDYRDIEKKTNPRGSVEGYIASKPYLEELRSKYKDTIGQEPSGFFSDLYSEVSNKLENWDENVQKHADDLNRMKEEVERERLANRSENEIFLESPAGDLYRQILAQGTTGKWTGEGFGGPEANAKVMASLLANAGITDLKDFGKITSDDGIEFWGNKKTKQPIYQNYSGVGGNVWQGTYTGHGRTNFGVQFAPDGTPYFYTQFGGDTSSMGDIVPIVALGLSIFAPGVGTAIGAALGATGTAAAVLGGAIVSGTLAEISGGDFVDGAIKGGISAGLAPAVSSAIGSSVASAMADSAVKNVVTNAITSSATSALTAGLTGGDVGQAAMTGALVGAGSAAGQELGIAAKYGTDAFSEQSQALLSQERGLGGASQVGGTLGSAVGKIAAGSDAEKTLTSALISTVTQGVTDALRTTVRDSLKDPSAIVAESGEPDFGFEVPNADNLLNIISGSPTQVATTDDDADLAANVPGSENLAGLTGGQGVDVPGIDNLETLPTGGETVAGPGGFTTNMVSAMPQMQPRANETAGDVQEILAEDGSTVYRRTIYTTLANGDVATYDITYDPDDERKPIRYETVSGDTTSGFNIRSSATRPDFETETGVSTDTSLPGVSPELEDGSSDFGDVKIPEPTQTELLEKSQEDAEAERIEFEMAEAARLDSERIEAERVRREAAEAEIKRQEEVQRQAAEARLEAQREEARQSEIAEAARLAKVAEDQVAAEAAAQRARDEADRQAAIVAEAQAEADRLRLEEAEAVRLESERVDTDTLTGGVGEDTLDGGVSTDTSLPGGAIDGGTSVDVTAPGSGQDTLDGGISTDTTLPTDEQPIEQEPPTEEEPPIEEEDSGTTDMEECPEGYVRNLNTGVCEPVDTTEEERPQDCGEGYHWDEARQLCIPDSDEEEDDECPEGYIRNLNTGECIRITSDSGSGGGGAGGVGGGGGGGGRRPPSTLLSPFFIPERPIVSAPSISDDPVMRGALPDMPQETKFQGPLDQFLKIATGSSFTPKPQQPQQAQQQAGTMNDRLSYPQGGSDYFSYGQQSDIENNLGAQFGQAPGELPMDGALQFKQGGMATPLMAGGGNTRHGRYAGGGLDVISHSGKQRLDFRKGAAVTGPGDGQSDDIPAMLADGEFVFPADVVAALGNGSTKAGSDKLYDMMHSIRAYHRSAKPEDLPPPAKKSPLDYLKKAKKARS